MSKKLLYKFPSRERFDKFFAAVDNITSLSQHDNYEIVATLDLNDPSMRGEHVKERIASYNGKLRAIWGTSEGKIHACSRDMEFVGDFDIVCLHSDDMIFTKHGFDLDILEAFENFSGLVHFPDGFANERLCTYTMMDFPYYSRFNYLYNSEYASVYADQELHDVAKKLGRYKFVNKQILQHQHPTWGFGVKDALLQRTEDPALYAQDRETYNRRLRQNFDL